jgi:hypothetical protein
MIFVSWCRAPGRSVRWMRTRVRRPSLTRPRSMIFGEQGDVDVAAADQDRGAMAVEGGLLLEESGEGGSAGAFCQGFLAFEQDEDGAGDLLFVDGHELVDVFRDQGEGAVAGAADGDAVGDGRLGGDGDGVAGLAGSQHRGEALGLDADDANFRMALLDGAGDAADEPAAADGDDDGFEVGDLLEQLEADGSLPCDHLVVIEGMQEGEAVSAALADRFGAGLVVVGAVEDRRPRRNSRWRRLSPGAS